MGKPIIGIIHLKIQGKRGTPITLRYGEQILPDGHVNASISNINLAPDTVQQEDSYILRGDGEAESWQPRFTLHTFRYVEITGIEGELPAENITGIVYNTELSSPNK